VSLKERLGLDGFDLALHAVVTLALCAIASGFFVVRSRTPWSPRSWRSRQWPSASGAPSRSVARFRIGDSVRLEAVERRLEDLEVLHQRVGELEERLDFAERRLAREAERPRLPLGQTGL
jgi:hypothetical protein